MSKSKPVSAIIRMVINAGQAKPSPPVGPALGQHGLNLMGFCKEFNARTANIKPDVPVPVTLTAYKVKIFFLRLKTLCNYFNKGS